MTAVLTKNPGQLEMRKVYADTMIDMAAKDERVVALDADLMNPIGMMGFKAAYPDRAIDCGIMEQNMNGVAAGMSARGLIPFTHTFSCFQARKTLDQIFLTAGFAELNCKFVGSDPGVLALYNGASHMGIEDKGILLNVPNLTVVEPADGVALESIIRQAKDTYGNFYISMNRKMANTVYDPETKFEIGKGLVLRDGGDVTIISSGIMVEQALKAAETLAAEGIEARVIDMFTWQPLDEELIIESAKKTGAVVVAENHRKSTGLGNAVASVLAENIPTPMGRIGIGRTYGEVGSLDYLMEKFHLTAADIAEKAKETIARK